MGEDMQKPEALCTAVGMENATATWGPVWWVLRKLNLEQPDKPALPLLGLQPEALTAETGIDPCAPAFTAAWFPAGGGRNSTSARGGTNG